MTKIRADKGYRDLAKNPVVLGDGSVRFIKDSISLSTWKALSSRAGGEVISSDAL